MAAELSVSTESPSLQPLVAAAAIMGRSESRRRVDLGGILLDRIDLEGARQRLQEFVRSGQPHQVVTVNLDFVSIASRQPAFRSTLNAADLAVADGMPLVWLSRLKGEPLEERVAGVELVSESCRLANQLGSGV
ncbi:MAG TPA: WecB/TagA/CpsF family glycosyltransferase, partial [Chloroflexota bacterium]